MENLESSNLNPDNALTQSESATIDSSITEVTPHQVTQSEPSGQPISFSLKADYRQLLTLVLGGCLIVIIAMSLSGDMCLGIAGIICNMNDGPASNPITEDFLSVAIALGFFAISIPLGLSALPALAVSMGIWGVVKAILSVQ
jgi:hypothetical protein